LKISKFEKPYKTIKVLRSQNFQFRKFKFENKNKKKKYRRKRKKGHWGGPHDSLFISFSSLAIGSKP
jgi:hypothetical protein